MKAVVAKLPPQRVQIKQDQAAGRTLAPTGKGRDT
mgnify:CR=1 FL=1